MAWTVEKATDLFLLDVRRPMFVLEMAKARATSSDPAQRKAAKTAAQNARAEIHQAILKYYKGIR